jgi:hypothetical protein
MRLPRPLPSSPVSKLSIFLSLSVCRRSRLLKEGGGGGRGAEFYDRMKARPSINRSMLSEMLSYILLIAESAVKCLRVGVGILLYILLVADSATRCLLDQGGDSFIHVILVSVSHVLVGTVWYQYILVVSDSASRCLPGRVGDFTSS